MKSNIYVKHIRSILKKKKKFRVRQSGNVDNNLPRQAVSN